MKCICNVKYIFHITYHKSQITFHISHITQHISHITYHIHTSYMYTQALGRGRAGAARSPVTNATLKTLSLTPNPMLQSEIRQVEKRKKRHGHVSMSTIHQSRLLYMRQAYCLYIYESFSLANLFYLIVILSSLLGRSPGVLGFQVLVLCMLRYSRLNFLLF